MCNDRTTFDQPKHFQKFISGLIIKPCRIVQNFFKLTNYFTLMYDCSTSAQESLRPIIVKHFYWPVAVQIKITNFMSDQISWREMRESTFRRLFASFAQISDSKILKIHSKIFAISIFTGEHIDLFMIISANHFLSLESREPIFIFLLKRKKILQKSSKNDARHFLGLNNI